MTCQEAINLLSDYLDGELNSETQKKLTDHLKICSSCAKEYRQLQRSLKILKRLQQKEIPRDFLNFFD